MLIDEDVGVTDPRPWCTWLTRDGVSHARDLHTVPFELFVER